MISTKSPDPPNGDFPAQTEKVERLSAPLQTLLERLLFPPRRGAESRETPKENGDVRVMRIKTKKSWLWANPLFSSNFWWR